MNDLQATDRCVMCGLCLPHCPTYRLTRDEGDSPRGRIALMQALDRSELAPGPRLRSHLARCLECRACEAMCPSKVPFGELMDAARARLRPADPLPPLGRLALDRLIPHRGRLRILDHGLRVYRASGLQRAARALGVPARLGLGQLEQALPRLPAPPRWRAYYPPTGAARGDVALFTGCVAELADPATGRAAIAVLNRFGYGVHVPRDQACCGALHLHNGDPAGAARLAKRNLQAFAAPQWLAVIATASGCGAQLTEYGRLPGLDGDGANFAERVRDITTFLAAAPWPADLRPAPLAARAALHLPCSLRNALRETRAPQTLLAHIPDLTLLPLESQGRCCGAAGSYFITQPELSVQLRDGQVAAVRECGPDLLLTANIGCALQLAAGLQASAGAPPEVLHPIVLLARQLAAAGQLPGYAP